MSSLFVVTFQEGGLGITNLSKIFYPKLLVPDRPSTSSVSLPSFGFYLELLQSHVSNT